MKREKNRKKNQHGAVTVFLALVLVPCIIFVCAFGDISRVELSKARASSAADLSLYSLMSHYDADLQEFYGIVASCQDVNKFYEEATNYFVGMMAASGMEDTGQDLFIEYMDKLASGNVTDLLQVDVASDFKIEPAANGAVGENPALIEDSIVEFMKYRGPVEIVTNLVERFSSIDFSSAKDADKNQEVAEAKTEAAEAEGELLKAALYTYLAMKQYQDYYRANDIPSISKYADYAEKLPIIWRDYQKVTETITRYYAGAMKKYGGTVDIALINFPMYTLNEYTYEAKDVGTKVIHDSGTLYCIGKDDLTELLKNIDAYIQEVETAQSNIVNACSSLPDSVAASTDINDVRYALAVQTSVSSSDLNTMTSRGKELMKRYAMLKAAKDCEPYPEVEGGDAVNENALPEDWQTQLDQAMSKIAALQGKYYTTSASNAYIKLVNNYYITARDRGAVAGVQDLKYEFDSELLGKKATIGQFNEKIKEIVADAFDKLDSQYDRLNIILNGGTITYNGTTYEVVSLETLLELAQNYSEARDNWGDTAENAGTEYGDSEHDLYMGVVVDNLATESESLASAIDEEAVNNTIARISNIMKDIENLRTALENFTYGGKPATKMSSREEIIMAGCTVISANQSLYLKENDSAASGYHTSLIQPSTSDFYTAPTLVTGETGNNPDLNTDCSFFRFLVESFPDSRLDEIESTVKENDENTKRYKEEAEKAQETAEGVEDKYLKGRGGDIEDASGGSRYSETTGILSLISIAENIATGNIDEIRDQVYVCEYIMDMFSYSAFNNEGEYHLTGEQYTLADFTDQAFPDSWEAWNTEDPTDLYENQSLTNRQINAKNNKANLAEVEYILFGNKSSDENLKAAYRNIFEIREVMNLASGFLNFYSVQMDSENSKAISAIATNIFTLSAGVIPVPLTKCLLITVLATMESAHDLARLKAGIPVTIYKMKEENWYCKLEVEKAVVNGFNGLSEPEDKNGIYYSDYMRLFLLLGLTNSSTYNSFLKRTGDVIQANMRLTEGNNDFDLKKSICYFQLSGQLRVKPLLLTLPIVDSMQGVDASTVREKTDWCTYEIKVIRGYS